MPWNRLIDLRKGIGLSQEELADKIGVSQKSISKYENQTVRPSWEAFLAMADLFNVSTDYLLGRTDILSFDDIPTLRKDSRKFSDNTTMLLENFEKLGKEDQALILGKTIELAREQQKAANSAIPLKKVQ